MSSVRAVSRRLAALLVPLALEATPAHAQDDAMPGALTTALETHGGLDAWQGYGTLTFDFTRTASGGTLDDTQLVDLNARRVRIESDAYTIVHDGQDVGIAPSADALNYGASPRFYSQTYFYFFAVPFVLADPGLNYEQLAPATIDGTTYDVVRVTFDAGVGESPEDTYILYVEQDTGQARMLRYSVTYGDIDRPEPQSVLVYTEWQEVDGLVVPRRGTFHPWQDGAPGAQTAVVTYDNVDVRTARPADAQFAMPEGAERIPPPQQ